MSRPAEYLGPDGKTYRNPFFPEAELTPDIFWSYFAPEVGTLREMDFRTPEQAAARSAKAFDLLSKGFIVPALQIGIYGDDPVTFLGVKGTQGFVWFPALGEPDVYPQATQGIPVVINGVALPVYDPDHPPKRSCPCSLLKKDWPPFLPVKPVDPNVPAALPMVGNAMGGGFYGRGPGARPDTVVNGNQYTAPDGRAVIAVVSEGGLVGMGWSCYFKVK